MQQALGQVLLVVLFEHVLLLEVAEEHDGLVKHHLDVVLVHALRVQRGEGRAACGEEECCGAFVAGASLSAGRQLQTAAAAEAEHRQPH